MFQREAHFFNTHQESLLFFPLVFQFAIVQLELLHLKFRGHQERSFKH